MLLLSARQGSLSGSYRWLANKGENNRKCLLIGPLHHDITKLFQVSASQKYV